MSSWGDLAGCEVVSAVAPPHAAAKVPGQIAPFPASRHRLNEADGLAQCLRKASCQLLAKAVDHADSAAHGGASRDLMTAARSRHGLRCRTDRGQDRLAR